nr:MAG TPA: hypothetical protein [Caudoviricetes sp.]
MHYSFHLIVCTYKVVTTFSPMLPFVIAVKSLYRPYLL